MDPWLIVQRSVPGADLRPGQVAQLRAIDAKYQTELYAIEHHTSAEGQSILSPDVEMRALQSRIVSDIRDILNLDSI